MKNSIQGSMLRLIAVAAALLIAPTVLAHTQQAGDLQIIHPWAAPLVEGAHFPLTLELADGRGITFHVVVGEMSAMLEIQ